MAKSGRVILVGAGPGDPGLLTLAAKAALESADVILYDRLVGDGILAMMPAGAEKIDVGKNKGRHPVPQDDINRLLVEHARSGKTVVRLKGGDPFLFGRGGEELERIAAEGIPFRVVPGVTSAIAAPACAGIPVTHRNFSSSLHILTGHGKDGGRPDIPYRELARLNGTLVFLMGLSAFGDICRGLIDAGMAADTPAAIVENGTRSDQRRIDGTVATAPELARDNAVASPAILVVGGVCALAGELDRRAALPLRGKAVLVVSSRATGSRLAARLREYGCDADEFAGIAPEPLPVDEALWRNIGHYQWIVFSSRFGAELFFALLSERRIDIRSLAAARFAVVGSRTGSALEERGILPDFVPDEYSGQRLGEGLARLCRPGDRVLLFRAEAGGDDLPRILRDGGLAVDDVPAYRTIARAPSPEIVDRLRSGRYDAITFSSASAVEAFAATTVDMDQTVVVCIGEATAAAARRLGMEPLVGERATIESMADLIVERVGQA